VLKFTFKFLHSFLVSILSMQNVLLECQVLFAEYTWEQPVAFCFWYLKGYVCWVVPVGVLS